MWLWWHHISPPLVLFWGVGGRRVELAGGGRLWHHQSHMTKFRRIDVPWGKGTRGHQTTYTVCLYKHGWWNTGHIHRDRNVRWTLINFIFPKHREIWCLPNYTSTTINFQFRITWFTHDCDIHVGGLTGTNHNLITTILGSALELGGGALMPTHTHTHTHTHWIINFIHAI